MRIFRYAMMLSILCLGPVRAADAPQAGWKLEGNGAAQYEVGSEPAGSPDRHGAFLRARSDLAPGAQLVQRLPAQAYAGKRVRLSAALKTEGADGAVLAIDVSRDAVTIDTRPTAYIYGTNDWKNYSAVIDVPADATTVRIGFGLRGRGTLWADNIGIQPVSAEVSLTPMHYAWGRTGTFEPHDFEYGATPQEDGKDALYIKSRANVPANGFIGLQQCVPARDYLGKRVRFAGRIKTVNATSGRDLGANFYMRVDGTGKSLGFTNAGVRPVKGTSDWERQSAVLDVPAGSIRVCYGLVFSGNQGEAQADSVALEVVGTDVAVTSSYEGAPVIFRANGAGGMGRIEGRTLNGL